MEERPQRRVLINKPGDLECGHLVWGGEVAQSRGCRGLQNQQWLFRAQGLAGAGDPGGETEYPSAGRAGLARRRGSGWERTWDHAPLLATSVPAAAAGAAAVAAAAHPRRAHGEYRTPPQSGGLLQVHAG